MREAKIQISGRGKCCGSVFIIKIFNMCSSLMFMQSNNCQFPSVLPPVSTASYLINKDVTSMTAADSAIAACETNISIRMAWNVNFVATKAGSYVLYNYNNNRRDSSPDWARSV